MPRDPYTGVDIPQGASIATCPRHHVNMLDSWKEGNRCHYPGCGYSGNPPFTGVNSDLGIHVGARQRETSNQQAAIVTPPADRSITSAGSDGFNIRVVNQQRIVRVEPPPTPSPARPNVPGWGAAFAQSLLITGVIAILVSIALASALAASSLAFAIIIVCAIALLISVMVASARSGRLRRCPPTLTPAPRLAQRQP